MYTVLLLFSCAGDHRDLHSFPTRRSSDLTWEPNIIVDLTRTAAEPDTGPLTANDRNHDFDFNYGHWKVRVSRLDRSEEHTSELQSHSDLVCRLLLEKKKKNQ